MAASLLNSSLAFLAAFFACVHGLRAFELVKEGQPRAVLVVPDENRLVPLYAAKES